jgi:Protein of unknown function (DUF3176)
MNSSSVPIPSSQFQARTGTSTATMQHNMRYEEIQAARPWSPGIADRFPWTGSLAVFGVVFYILATVVVLVTANGAPVESWPSPNHSLQPAVLLAICSAVANLLRFALQEGTTTSWWHKAHKGGTLGDLHRRVRRLLNSLSLPYKMCDICQQFCLTSHVLDRAFIEIPIFEEIRLTLKIRSGNLALAFGPLY